MLYPIRITIDGYVQADGLEEAELIAKNLELRTLELQDERAPDDPFGVQLEQCEIAERSVADIAD